MIEGAVLHHQDDDVVDVGQWSGLEWVLRVFGKWFELPGWDDVVDNQGLTVTAGVEDVERAADQPGVRISLTVSRLSWSAEKTLAFSVPGDVAAGERRPTLAVACSTAQACNVTTSLGLAAGTSSGWSRRCTAGSTFVGRSSKRRTAG
jgi:hypothetical protein